LAKGQFQTPAISESDVMLDLSFSRCTQTILNIAFVESQMGKDRDDPEQIITPSISGCPDTPIVGIFSHYSIACQISMAGNMSYTIEKYR
jgi:hypothetical protein